MFRLPCPTRFIQGFIAQVYDPVELFFSSSSYFLFTVSASVFLLFYFPPFFCCTNRFAVSLAPMAAGPRKLQQPALRHHFFFLLIHSDGNVRNRATASRAAMNEGAPLS
jgi:hypothetical protein